MDLVLIAQLITGIATLLVASVLIYELRIQHNDSVRDFQFQRETQLLEITNLVLENNEFTDLWIRGGEDYNNLKTDVERYQFNIYMRNYIRLAIFQAEKIPDNSNRAVARFILSGPGRRHVYKSNLKHMVYNRAPNLSKIWDEVYKEFSGEDISNVIPDIIPGTINYKAYEESSGAKIKD